MLTFQLLALFRPVQTQKVEKGTDPKSVVCAFFKAGQCGKGDRCKFSHDLTVERKVEKRSLYVDMRDEDGDTMENWNEEKLQQVVDTKHGLEKRMPTTDIVSKKFILVDPVDTVLTIDVLSSKKICKFFLDAVEKSKYGWFWECPNGEKCIYRHALPQGYVLKRDKKKLEDKGPEISLVDLIERERNALGSTVVNIKSLKIIRRSSSHCTKKIFFVFFIDKSHVGIIFGMEETKNSREKG